MADSNTPTSSEATKLISLSNLETYTGYVERKSVPVTREQYTALPSTKLTDGISYFITDEGIIIKNGVSYGASTSSDTTYSLSAGTGDDANKIILTPSSGTPDKVTVPYATTAGSADNATTVNNHTVASDVPADAVFTDNNTTYGLSVGTGDDANKIVLTPSTGTADKITVPYASNAGTVNGYSVAVDVPSDAEFTDTTYEEATTSTAGLLSSADKTKLNNLGTAAYRDIPTSGNASTSEVVLGTDTRLTDARNAADVYSWAKAATKPSYTASEVGAIATAAKGANNGVAELDSTGKVPSSQLPSYVDDVLEYNSSSDFPLTGETGKIYIAKDTNKTYRWSGTTYTEISESLALGETSSTAYAGNKGKANADAIAAIKDGSTIDSFGDVETALADKVEGSGTSGYIAKFNGTDSITNGPQLGSSTTTFLRNDGIWDTPPNDDTTYSLSVGTGDDANKIVLTPSDGNPDKIVVPYAISAGDASTINGHDADNVFQGTTAEWEALTTDQKKAYDGVLITDDYDAPDHMDADEVDFSNTGTSLVSTDVQSAIVEIANGLGTAAFKDVASSGDASSTQVVMGNDSRLSDSRNAKDVYSWAKASSKPSYTASEVGAIAISAKGTANGVAELDANGLVPSSQLPSYVDDILEYSSLSEFPATGETGKIYVATDTNLTYRWSGSAYVEISPSLALGETSSTAYRGDRGKAAYDHATDSSRLTTAQTSGLYKIATTAEGHVASVIEVQKSDITALGIPESDTNTTYTFVNGINGFTVTPSGGSAQTVTVTPSVTASDVSASTTKLTGDTVEDKLDDAGFRIQVNTQNIGNTFRSNKSYKVGEYVLYNNILWKCTTAHSGEWSSSDFYATNLCEAIYKSQFIGTTTEWNAISTAIKKTFDEVIITDD